MFRHRLMCLMGIAGFLGFSLIGAAPNARAQSNLFRAARNYPAGIEPIGVAAGDFNNDGKPDLFVGGATCSNETCGKDAVLLNNGDGTYRSSILGGACGPAILVGDFNNDGNLDVFRVQCSELLLGNGDGTFKETSPFGTNAFAGAVGDFNNDGNLDVALVDNINPQGVPEVSVYLGNGDGTFQSPKIFSTGNTFPLVSIAAKDLNGDGNLDLAVGNTNGIEVFLGDGKGSFQAPVSYSTTSAPSSNPGVILAADLNGDGSPDLAVAISGGMNLFFNNGDGTFQSPITIPTTGPVVSIGAADFNGDGRTDIAMIVTTKLGATRLGVLLQNSGGSFEPEVDYLTGSEPSALAITDVDGDGIADVLTANLSGNDISVAKGLGDGTFIAATPIRTDGTGAAGVAIADFNGDGRMDFAVGEIGRGNVNVFLGKRDGTFRLATIPMTSSVQVVNTADFNNDGRPDLVLGGEVFLGNGDGAFTPKGGIAGTGHLLQIETGDLNGDGKLDMEGAFGSNIIGTALGNGDGTFQSTTDQLGVGVRSIALRDVNGDGKLDVVISGFSGLNVFFGKGDGTFRPIKRLGGPASFWIATGDFNHDGKVDLVVADGTPFSEDFPATTVSVLLGNGDGTFQSRTTYPLYASPDIVKVADINGDGNDDILVTTPSGISVLLGNGDGTFQPAINYGTGISEGSGFFAVGDLNADGAPDLIVSGPGINNSVNSSQNFVAEILSERGAAVKLTSSADPSSPGQSVTFTATVTPTLEDSGQPTGNIVFKDGATVLGTSPLNGGKANLTTSGLASGTHTIQAVYSGDNNFNTNASAVLTQSVD